MNQRFRIALQWAQALDEGEMIQTRTYRKTHLGFEGTISCPELNQLCDFLNHYWRLIASNRRCSWSAGELIPGIIDVSPFDNSGV